MNIYDRIFNILREGRTFGSSPTKTGTRVGRFISKLEDQDPEPDHLQRKKAQAVRIAQKTAERQGKWHGQAREIEGTGGRYGDKSVEDVRQGAAKGAHERFKGAYYAEKGMRQAMKTTKTPMKDFKRGR